MTRIFVDETLRAKLNNLSEPLELCDQAGKVIGRVFPSRDLPEYEAWEPSFTEEELQRQEQANEKRYSTADVLAHLAKL